MGSIESQITSLTIVYSIIYSNADQRKHPCHWPLCGEFTGDRWIPRTNGQLRGKCFHFMTSSWDVFRDTETNIHRFNSRCFSGSIWWPRPVSTMIQVMACCLTAPSLHLKQCWPMIKQVLWHSLEGNCTGNAQNIYPWYEFQCYQSKKTATSPRS